MGRQGVFYSENHQKETVGDGAHDVPPENAQHFSDTVPNGRFAVGSSRAPTPTTGFPCNHDMLFFGLLYSRGYAIIF